METRLKTAGYPESKITTVIDEDGVHSEDFWAVYLPETLCFGLQIK